jgi:glycosyltransferase involved in cell wall biosynthesis
LERSLPPQTPPERTAFPAQGGAALRVAWFGHAEGRRADGLSTYSRETVQGLRRHGVQVQFVSHGVDGSIAPAPLSASLRAVRFKTVTIPGPGYADRMARILDEFRPDVVHCSWSFSLRDGRIGRMAHERGAAAVATFHLPYAAPHSARGRVLQGLYRYHVHHLRHFDTCVALSEGQRELLVAAGYPASRVEVIHNGVDVDTVSPGPSSLPERLGARFVVLYLGRLDPEKRVPALVRTFLSLGWPEDHVLVIAGGGVQQSRVRKLAEGRRNVRVLGVVADAQERLDLLRGADVFVLPSTAEGLALSMLEGMAAGCAVIATDVGEDGAALAGAGLRIPAHPLESNLARALEQLRGDAALRRELGLRARARVVEHYGLERNLGRLLDIYQRLRVGAAAA